jgi:hypothetical protein
VGILSTGVRRCSDVQILYPLRTRNHPFIALALCPDRQFTADCCATCDVDSCNTSASLSLGKTHTHTHTHTHIHTHAHTITCNCPVASASWCILLLLTNSSQWSFPHIMNSRNPYQSLDMFCKRLCLRLGCVSSDSFPRPLAFVLLSPAISTPRRFYIILLGRLWVEAFLFHIHYPAWLLPRKDLLSAVTVLG